MSKVKNFEELSALGVNTIHEHTHISRAKLELLLTKSFGELNRVQFMGFVSILEREYGLNLDLLRQEYDGFIHENPEVALPKESVLFQTQSNERVLWIVGGILFIILLIGALVLMQKEFSALPKEDVITLNSVDINVSKLVVETNNTNDANVSENNNSDANSTLSEEMNNTVKTSEMTNLGSIVRIEPASKVWVGMMDVATGIKTQKMTKESIVIDTTKNWLFIFGHGRLKLIGKENNITLKERNAAWFAYENGSLYQLTSEQFNIRNKGNNW